MPELSAGELTAMRATQADTLPGTAVISRNTPTSDGMGGWTDAWAAIGTVDGRVAPAQGRRCGNTRYPSIPGRSWSSR